MKRKICTVIAAIVFIVAAMALTACGDSAPYEDLDENGYTISVRYDANGADFAKNGTYMKIIDVYHSGSTAIQLFDPNDSVVRGENHSFNAEETVPFENYKLDGWWQAAQNEKGEVLDEDGVPVSESGKEPLLIKKWDFATDRFIPEAGKTYSSETPAITLIAKWVPHYTYEFYYEDEDGEWQAFTANTANGVENFNHHGYSLRLPTLDVSLNADGSYKGGLGSLTFYSDFKPASTLQADAFSGKTLMGIYTDPSCSGESVLSRKPGLGLDIFYGDDYYAAYPELDPETDIIKLYTKWEDAVTYDVYFAAQFNQICQKIEKSEIASGTLNIKGDLDFTGINWHFDSKEFDLVIEGNGYSFTGITAKQEDSVMYATYGGMFKSLGENAVIRNLTVKNSTYTLDGYSKPDYAGFGFFAGNVNANAVIENVALGEGCRIILSSTALSGKQKNNLINMNTEVYAGAPGNHDIDFSGVTVDSGTLEHTIYAYDGWIEFT